MEHDEMYTSLKAARQRMTSASGTNEEMLALFDGLTVTLAAVVKELAQIRESIKEAGGAHYQRGGRDA